MSVHQATTENIYIIAVYTIRRYITEYYYPASHETVLAGAEFLTDYYLTIRIKS